MNILTTLGIRNLGSKTLPLIAAMLLCSVSQVVRAEYIPNENFEPVWIGTEDEPVEGSDCSDPDGDQLVTWLESYFGTGTWNFDTDGDGIPDGWEIANGLNPQDAGDIADDPDSDFILNVEEYQHGSNPHEWDDFWSVMGYPVDTSNLNRQNDDSERDADWDNDGRNNIDELCHGSDPRMNELPEEQPSLPEPTVDEANSGDDSDEAPSQPGTPPREPTPPPTPPVEPSPPPEPPAPEPAPTEDPNDLPWYEDAWNGITNFFETLFWSPAPVDGATFQALEGTAGLVDPLTERQQAIEGLMENYNNVSETEPHEINSADPNDYAGSNGTVEQPAN